jgi:hypothetical protein
MKQSFPFLLVTVASLSLFSCSSSVYKDVYPTLLDGRYDSEFPYRGCSKQLEEISETVKRVSVMANYKTYYFGRDDSVRVSDISKRLLELKDATVSFQSQSVAGTATIIYGENNRIAVLTCAHVVDFSDTIITRYSGPDYRPTPFVRSLAIKTNQLMFLNEVAGGVSLEILAFDRVADLAILGQKLDPDRNYHVPVFHYPLGKSKELEWGSFVYMFGYPGGYRMVTKGIVSLPRMPQGAFVVDAVISPGASGSIALAIRDGVPNFELVGIVKMVPGQTTYVLAPSTTGQVEYDPEEPYHGDAFVQRKPEIHPGISMAIPTEAIISFIENNSSVLQKKGYDLTTWIHPPAKQSR